MEQNNTDSAQNSRTDGCPFAAISFPAGIHHLTNKDSADNHSIRFNTFEDSWRQKHQHGKMLIRADVPKV